MTNTTITVPDIGGSAAEVVEVLVAIGDVVVLDQSLIVLESDKASMEIPATAAGTVTEIKIAVGDQLSEGDVVLVVGVEADSDAGVDSKAAPSMEQAAAPEAMPPAGDKTAPASTASAPVSTQVMTVEVPDIGTDEAVEIVELCVAVGDEVAEGDSLLVLESDKASMEVPAPYAGTVAEWLVAAGDKASQGTAIVKLSAIGVSAAPAAGAAKPESVIEPPADSPAAFSASVQPVAMAAKIDNANPTTAESESDSVSYAGPAVRKLAREFGVVLAKVVGSGPRGRILKEDLHTFVKQALTQAAPSTAVQGTAIPAIPEVDFAKFGDIDPQPRSRIDKITAMNMSRNWLNVPHVTQFDDADITELERFRQDLSAEAERRGAKLTPIPFIIKACAVALNANPKLKSALADNGETLVYKSYCHIGMAVDTPAGLVVPVLRDVDKKSIWEISAEVAELAGLARDKKLKPDQMQGAVFTISSLGNIGGRGFTPIVNAPEVAILGVSRADIQPVWNGSEFAPRKMLPLALSYDHRVVNGGDAGRFLTQLVGLLADIRRMIM